MIWLSNILAMIVPDEGYSINASCALLTSRYLKYDTNFKYYLLERTRLVAVETILFLNVIKDAVIVDEPGLLFRIFTQIFALEPGLRTFGTVTIYELRQTNIILDGKMYFFL
jgi:hypothetical protein